MLLKLGSIGQIALSVSNADRAEIFYSQVLGLKWLYRFDDLVFFDCDGVRLMLSQHEDKAEVDKASILYFRCGDIFEVQQTLTAQGVRFEGPPHCIAQMENHDLWMSFFRDPDQHLLALMYEAPKGYNPPPSAAT